jgi:hypothetical protein
MNYSSMNEKEKEIASHVMERYQLVFPCGCGYFIDSVSEGNFFCPIHAEKIAIANNKLFDKK